jgi:23S rRNA (cytidine2498-2'-O)-methyltransferase
MIAYLAPEDFLYELLQELKSVHSVHGLLVLTDAPLQNPVWAEQIWLDCHIEKFESIRQAAQLLRAQNFLWAVYSHDHHRRAQLIQEQLPKLKERAIDFLGPLPENNIGAWTLLDKNTVLYSAKTNSVFALGQVKFKESRFPPSRAYLKLWELMTLYGVKPKKGQKVIDFGSCPGGWTWVLQQIGCKVISIDRAPLDDKIAVLPGVEFIKTNAFNLEPEDLGAVDWFFSDIICYPGKLYELVEKWLASGLCSNFVCTIKFQGETDFVSVEKFKKLPNARVQHLHHNKHEVTVWINTDHSSEIK